MLTSALGQTVVLAANATGMVKSVLGTLSTWVIVAAAIWAAWGCVKTVV